MQHHTESSNGAWWQGQELDGIWTRDKLAGLRLGSVFHGRRSLGSWPLNEVRNWTNTKDSKVGFSGWKRDELRESLELKWKGRASLFTFVLLSFFFSTASHIRVSPTPANRLQIYRIDTCILHQLFRECFVPILPPFGGREEHHIWWGNKESLKRSGSFPVWPFPSLPKWFSHPKVLDGAERGGHSRCRRELPVVCWHPP